MAKPEHTPYQVIADFSAAEKCDFALANIDITDENKHLALSPECMKGELVRIRTEHWRKIQANPMIFELPENGHVTFGFDSAFALLEQARKLAKKHFKKGQRPSFYLRKLTMSEFMVHKEFQKHMKSNKTIQKVYKDFLLFEHMK